MRKAWGRRAIVAGSLVAAVFGIGLSIYWNLGCGAKSDCEGMTNPDLAFVVVLTEDVPRGTELSPNDERLMEIQIPRDLLVEGAVTDAEQLVRMTTKTTIYANEQIITSRLQFCPEGTFCQIGDDIAST